MGEEDVKCMLQLNLIFICGVQIDPVAEESLTQAEVSPASSSESISLCTAAMAAPLPIRLISTC